MKVHVCIDVELDDKTAKILELAGIDIEDMVRKALEKIVGELGAAVTTSGSKEVSTGGKSKGSSKRSEVRTMIKRTKDGEVDWVWFLEQLAEGRKDILAVLTSAPHNATKLLDLIKKERAGKAEKLGRWETQNRIFVLFHDKGEDKYYLFMLGRKTPYIIYRSSQGREPFINNICNTRTVPPHICRRIENKLKE